MMKQTMIHIMVIGALAALSTTGCNRPKPVADDAEKAAILKYADSATDRILKGHNTNSYADYSADFSEKMRKALPEAKFKSTRDMILATSGKYERRTVGNVLKKGKFVIVVYFAEFDKEKGVRITVTFAKKNGKQEVVGLWFASPKLKAAAEKKK